MSKPKNHTQGGTFKKPNQNSVPFSNKPINLRQASKTDIYGTKARKNCATCRYFEMSSMSAPCGWCHKFPSQQVNCAVGNVCDCWEQKGPAGGLFTECEILSRIIDGATGVHVDLPRTEGMQVTQDTLNYKAQVAAVMSSLGCTDKEYIINALTDERIAVTIKENVAPGELALKLIEEKPEE